MPLARVTRQKDDKKNTIRTPNENQTALSLNIIIICININVQSILMFQDRSNENKPAGGYS